MRRLIGLALFTTAACTTTPDTTTPTTQDVFDQDALAHYSLGDRAFVEGHALAVLVYAQTIPKHTVHTGFTYTSGLSAPHAKVAYDWNSVIADPTGVGVTTSTCNFDTCVPGTGGGSGSGGGDGSGSGSGSGGGDGSGSGSGGGGACETFLQPAADDANTIIARLDRTTIMGDAFAGQTAQYSARFDAGVKQALGTEDQADKDKGVEMGPIRDQAITQDLCTHSPLVLDVDGTGIEASTVDTGVRFDLLGTGAAVQTAWPSHGALLVLDRDGDGRITSGRELFGNGNGAGNGFADLAELDRAPAGGNGDGVIDARDAMFAKLRLWRDADRDGVSQPAELSTLASSHVASVPLAYTTSEDRDRFGNPLHETGTYVRDDASAGAIVDVWFRYRR